jgi:hypothetical protein
VGAAPCAEDGDCGVNGPCVGATYTILPTSIDTTTHVATAPVTSFSTFAVLHPNVLTGGAVVPRIPGAGNPRRDCGAEWEVVNATNTPFLRRGAINWRQTCQDGDANCDNDQMADGTCTFRVAICLNQADPALPECTPGTTDGVHVTLGRTPEQVANADALLGALEALGGTRGGRRLDDITFSPTLAGSQCTVFTELTVPAGKRQTFRLRTAGGVPDVDRLRLICSPE